MAEIDVSKTLAGLVDTYPDLVPEFEHRISAPADRSTLLFPAVLEFEAHRTRAVPG